MFVPVAVTIALVATACASATPPVGEQPMTYRQQLERLQRAGVPFPAGSDAERRAMERFEALLADFKAPDFRQRVREVYAEDVWFNDTLKTIEGVDELERYLVKSGEALDEGTVEFLGWIPDRGDYYVRWEMSLRFKKYGGGETLRSIGMSHIRFDADGRVVLHQDFWDSTGGLFEHLPAVGWMLRSIKRRL